MDKIVDSMGRPWGARHSAVRALTRAVAQMGRAGEKITVESLTAFFLRETGLFNVPAKLKGDIVGLIDSTFADVAKEDALAAATGTFVDVAPPAKAAPVTTTVGLTAAELDEWLDEVNQDAAGDEKASDVARLQKASLREAIDIAHKNISDGLRSPVTYQWDVVTVAGVRYLRIVTRRICIRERVADTEDTCYNINGDRDVIKTAVTRLSSDVKAPVGFKGKAVTGVLFGYLIPVSGTSFLDGSTSLRMWINKRSPTFTGDVGVKLYISPVEGAPYFVAKRVSLKK